MIDVVFVTWNARDVALRCVAHSRDPDIVASIVVVDNASTDGTADAVRTANPDVDVIALEQGVGLAAGLNMAARLGSAPFVLYLNDDAFADAGAIRTLVDALRSRPDAVAAGGRLVGSDGATQDPYRPRPFPTAGTVAALLIGLDRLWPRNPWTGGHRRRPLDDHRTVAVDQLAGACVLVRRDVVEAIGGWDERYWFWYEDVDLSRRLAAHGVSLYVPSATFDHVGGATAGRLRSADGHARYYHGALQYSSTHFSPAGRALVAAAMVAVSLTRAAVRGPTDRSAAGIYLRAAAGAAGLLLGRQVTPFDAPRRRRRAGR